MKNLSPKRNYAASGNAGSDRDDTRRTDNYAYKTFTKDKRTPAAQNGGAKRPYDAERGTDFHSSKRSYNPNFDSDNKPRFSRSENGYKKPEGGYGRSERPESNASGGRYAKPGYGSRTDASERERRQSTTPYAKPGYGNRADASERERRQSTTPYAKPGYGNRTDASERERRQSTTPYAKPGYGNRADAPERERRQSTTPYAKPTQGYKKPYASDQQRGPGHGKPDSATARPRQTGYAKPYGSTYNRHEADQRGKTYDPANGRRNSYTDRSETEGSRSNDYERRSEGGAGRPGRSQNTGYRPDSSRPKRPGGYRPGSQSSPRPGGRPGAAPGGYKKGVSKPYGAKRTQPGDYPTYPAPSLSEPLRLNRYIAMSGICSRREADDYIRAGVVSVNGKVVTELGSKVSEGDEVRFNDEPIKNEKKVYIVMNKPKGFVTSLDDPHADKTVMDLLKNGCRERVYPVGRLDKNSVGVLLVTNDGDLAKKLTHPSYEKKKVYQVTLDKPVTEEDMERIAKGVALDDGEVYADEISYMPDKKNEVGIEIHSGRNRIVRRIFEHLGYRVQKLDRVYFAGLTKQRLKRGAWRFLTPQEVALLKSGQYE